ncbi:MAG: class I SAM-dependent methyltransferase family protein [Planctomycetota bacterium]|jgi:hypothetical protein
MNTSGPVSVDHFFDTSVKEFQTELAAVEALSRQDSSPESNDILDQLTTAIHRSREACRDFGTQLQGSPDVLKQAQQTFREAIAPWFDQSWFMHRARVKPRGYPGDYQTLTGIYDQIPKSKGFGGYLDRYFLESDLARAVRGRLRDVQQFLIEEISERTEPISVLDVASGPGREYSKGFPPPRVPVSLHCVDTDLEALEFLNSHIDPALSRSVDVTSHRYNALKMSSVKANLETFGECDIIYSVGLCDYIPDRHMIKILQGWRESIAPGGVIYVAFKDATQYVAAEYQWHVDWFFFERTEADCRDLFAAAGYDVGGINMFRDDTGIIMNFVARDAALKHRRVDGAESVRKPHFASTSTPAANRVADRSAAE